MPAERISGRSLVRLVSLQLGRTPAIEFKVEAWCTYGCPAVIRSSPLDREGNPNPNLYYLTCPYLRKRLSRLEDEGMIGALQERLERDPDLMHDVNLAQKEHAREWLEAYQGLADAPRSGFRIAQTRADALLKCLHAHYAFYLVHRDYRLGQVIAGKLGEAWCLDRRCQAWAEQLKTGKQGEET
jgi:hypothetical protein